MKQRAGLSVVGLGQFPKTRPISPNLLNSLQSGTLLSAGIRAKPLYSNIPDQLKIGEYAMLPAGLIRKAIADSLFVSPTTRSFPEVRASTL